MQLTAFKILMAFRPLHLCALKVLVWCYYLLYGTVEARKFGHRIMCATFGFVAPALFGPIGAEGIENLPPS